MCIQVLRNLIAVVVLLASPSFAMEILEPAPGDLPAGKVNHEYIDSDGLIFLGDGGCTPGVFQLIGGSLPPGLALTEVDGLRAKISGTPTTEGTFAFTIRYKKSNNLPACIPGQNQPDIEDFSIEIGPEFDPLELTMVSLPDGVSSEPYGPVLVTSTGGVPDLDWSATEGLPEGLAIDAQTGVISGTLEPDAYLESPYSVTLRVSDSSVPPVTDEVVLDLVVGAPPLSIQVDELPDGIEGSPYVFQLSSFFGLPPYQYTVTGLPPSLTADNDVISGVLEVGDADASPYSVTIDVVDSALPVPADDQVVLNLVVLENPGGVLRITTLDLGTGQDGEDYATQLIAVGGEPAYEWSADGLPDGLELSTDGFISGTLGVMASAFSPYMVRVEVRDSASPAAVVEYTYAFNILSVGGQPTVLVMENSVFPDATEGESYEVVLSARGGIAPYSWEVGTLPSGLFLMPDGGEWFIRGSASLGQAGVRFVDLTVVDNNQSEITKTLTLNVSEAGDTSIVFLNTFLPQALEGKGYGPVDIQVENGVAPITISAQNLPQGVVLGQDSGGNWFLAGVPDLATNTPGIGVFDVVLTAEDSTPDTPLQSQVTLPLVVIPQSTTSSSALDDLGGGFVDLTQSAGCSINSHAERRSYWLLVGVLIGLGILSAGRTRAKA